MLGRLLREKRIPGWFAVSLDADQVDFAHGNFDSAAKSTISQYGSRKFDGEKPNLPKLAQAMRLGRYQCATLLRPGDYQLLQVEAPNVPREELRSAVRWLIKDMIDYPVDGATVDVLDIPPPEGAGARKHLVYAVSARNELIESTIRQFEAARIPLSVIDIPETGQRNIAALYESEERGVALAYFADHWGLLTINFRGELYLARRFDVGLQQMWADSAATEGGALERIGVEIQRTLDHFERQFRSIPVAKVLLAPAPRDTGLGAFLKARLGIDAQEIDLREVIAFDDAGPEKEAQWKLFHPIGAALRHETKAV